MIARPKEFTDDHLYILFWSILKHPDIKFLVFCKAARFQTTNLPVFPKGEIRLYAQQKRERLIKSKSAPDNFPYNFDPFKVIDQYAFDGQIPSFDVLFG